jgi:hypothetical protein
VVESVDVLRLVLLSKAQNELMTSELVRHLGNDRRILLIQSVKIVCHRVFSF